VTLNRPEAMNALDVATKELLLATLQRVAQDPAVRCVVLTGSGRAFCVGQDLREHIGLLSSRDDSLWSTVPKHYNPIVELLATMNKPVIAAINGVAAGAGASFAFAAKAKELLMFPRTVPASEALELGLVNRVVSAEELPAVVGGLARALAAGPTLAYGSIRRSVAYSAGHPLSESLAQEAEQMTVTGGSQDHAAAVSAFIAKEKPTFQGR